MSKTMHSKELVCTRVLLMAEKPLTIKEIQERMHMSYDRKNIYLLMDRLELAGYKTNIIRGKLNGHNRNWYEVKL